MENDKEFVLTLNGLESAASESKDQTLQETLENQKNSKRRIYLDPIIQNESFDAKEVYLYDNPLDTVANQFKGNRVPHKKLMKCVQCKVAIDNNKAADDALKKKRKQFCFNCCKDMIKQQPRRKAKNYFPSFELVINKSDSSIKRKTTSVKKDIGVNRFHLCTACEERFSSKKSLLQHRSLVHKNIRSYPCPDCELTFTRVNILTTHVSSVHEKRKPFLCIECNTSFSQKVNLNDHISSIHRKLKPFECPDCGSAFSRKGHLSKHVTAVHKQIKPYKCNVCEASFSRKHHMAHHVASVHQKLRPHACNICDSSFSCKRNLAKHISSVHMKVKPFRCSECGAHFSENRNLTAHVITKHTQLKLFHCSTCEMDFSLKRYLDHHVATMHKELPDVVLRPLAPLDPVIQLKKHLEAMKENSFRETSQTSNGFGPTTEGVAEEKDTLNERLLIYSSDPQNRTSLITLREDFRLGQHPLLDQKRLGNTVLDQERLDNTVLDQHCFTLQERDGKSDSYSSDNHIQNYQMDHNRSYDPLTS